MRANPIGQLISWLLMIGFALTAIGLMAIKDNEAPSLLDVQVRNLNQDRETNKDQSRRWIVVPGTPGSALR